jgi:hypothetical protein
MLAIRASAASRPLDAVSHAVWGNAHNPAPGHEVIHLLASLDQWLAQHVLAERWADNSAEAAHPMLDMSFDSAFDSKYPTLMLETFEIPDAPVSNRAVQAQKRADERAAKAQAKGLKHHSAPGVAAPATASLKGSATRVQTLRASAGGLSCPEVNPPQSLGSSPQTLKTIALVLLIAFMAAMGFLLLGHSSPQEEPALIESPLDGPRARFKSPS